VSSIILFRFHSAFALCRQRIRLIRYFNPSIPIYALYGGPASDFRRALKYMSSATDGVWSTGSEDARWKWLHQDVLVTEWFRQYGHTLTFDRLYDYEYDLVVAAPCTAFQRDPSAFTVAFSGLKTLAEVKARWYWTSVEPFATGFTEYQAYMHKRYGLQQQHYVSQGPFPILPRQFLEALASQEHPRRLLMSVNCETSYPGMAEALGFHVVDTGLHPGWTASIPSVTASPLFHCETMPLVGESDIVKELSVPHGLRAFHPVKEWIAADTLIRAITLGAEQSKPGT
jgi:hypothetical protein